MRLLPRASQVERAIPKRILYAMPRSIRPSQIASDWKKRRTNWRIYRKYYSHVEIQKFTAVFAILFVNFYIQFRTPIEHFMQLPSSDPNKFLKDPYLVKQLTDEQQRKHNMRQSIDHAGDDLQKTLSSYRKGHGLNTGDADAAASARSVNTPSGSPIPDDG